MDDISVVGGGTPDVILQLVVIIIAVFLVITWANDQSGSKPKK